MYFTTSWDDNCIENEKLADLLLNYGVKATFYLDKPQTNQSLIKDLSSEFTIGAHTLNHPHLTTLDWNEQKKEISQSKRILEDLLQISIELFAYPYGDYDKKTIEIVKESGFKYARTTKKYKYLFKNYSCYEMPTTSIVMPTKYEREKNISSFIKVYRNRRNIKKIFSLSFSETVQCSSSIIQIINNQHNKVDFIHIWGHAWQLDKYKYWENLESILSLISSMSGLDIIDNKELFKMMS